MQSMILPLPHTINIYRTPRDSRKVRRGILEGPLAGVFCREQTSFRQPEDAQGEGKQEIMDLLREMGLMLTLSQKRAREGKEEELPGKDQWWATKPRWPGGPGGETGVHETDEIEEPTSADAPRKRTKKTSRSELWRNLKPPPSTWEKGITYLQIGKDENSEYDDIYLFSTVNHHISILHLHIHYKYVDWLSKAYDRQHDVSRETWYKLDTKRSKWFDLFDAYDRAQAMRGIWAIMGWLMRDNGTEELKDQDMS